MLSGKGQSKLKLSGNGTSVSPGTRPCRVLRRRSLRGRIVGLDVGDDGCDVLIVGIARRVGGIDQ